MYMHPKSTTTTDQYKYVVKVNVKVLKLMIVCFCFDLMSFEVRTMAQHRFSLSWDSFQQNICSGLGALQQNEEFVDMTIAADGHFVKVHQLVLSLASPYIKDLIKSTQCQNPVIFLNNVSLTSLCSILEYIYTGEVLVAKENLQALIEAARALHIKGLKDMNYEATVSVTPSATTFIHDSRNAERFSTQKNKTTHQKVLQLAHEEDDDHHTLSSQSDLEMRVSSETPSVGTQNILPGPPEIQYSVSNQGNLQLVLNRYVYYLRYTSRSSNHRTWTCTDYIKKKCPASVTTKDNVVIKRTYAHIHPFHDKKIAKKVKAAAIFSLISEAEKEGENLKKNSQNSQ